jgi:hypothetical protein
MLEMAKALGTSAERAKLLRGLIKYRALMLALGLKGAQWVDGSFCEDIEAKEKRPPADIDIVTLLIRPIPLQDKTAWATAVSNNPVIFDATVAKATCGCHPFFVDIGMPAAYIFPQLIYYFGLFTHQRLSYLWKGLIQIPLVSDDLAASQHLDATYPP